jgi:hypothetical protein
MSQLTGLLTEAKENAAKAIAEADEKWINEQLTLISGKIKAESKKGLSMTTHDVSSGRVKPRKRLFQMLEDGGFEITEREVEDDRPNSWGGKEYFFDIYWK